MELFFNVVRESSESSVQELEVQEWLASFADPADPDKLVKPQMCSCLAKFCKATQDMDKDLAAKVVQAGLDDGPGMFKIIRVLKEEVFVRLWSLLKERLLQKFVQNHEGYKAKDPDAFMPNQAAWLDLCAAAADTSDMWDSMQPLAVILKVTDELPVIRATYLLSDCLRKCCLFMHRWESMNLDPDHAAPHKQADGMTRLIKDAELAFASLGQLLASDKVTEGTREQAKRWAAEKIVAYVFQGLQHMKHHLDEAVDGIPKGYEKLFDPETRNVQTIKSTLFNRKTHETVSMYSEEFSSVSQVATAAGKKFKAMNMLSAGHLQQLKNFDEKCTQIRVYCDLVKQLMC